MWKQIKRNYKRLVAFLLTIAMTFTNVGTNLNVAFAAGESEDALFLVDAGALQEAIREALENGEIFDFSSLELKAKSSSLKTSYQKLLGTKSGQVYGLDAEIDDSYAPNGTDLQVFYNARTEDVVFLFINESDRVVTFRANVGGYETSPITINPNTANVEDTDGAESFVEDYSNVVMVDDEPKRLGAEVISAEEELADDEAVRDDIASDEAVNDETASEMEDADEPAWEIASPSDAQASVSFHPVERVASGVATPSDAEYATPSDAGERDYDDFDGEDGQMLIDDLNDDSDYAVPVYGDLKGKSFNTVTIWETANARAYRVALKDLQGFEDALEIEKQESYSVDYSVDPVGAAEIKGSRTIEAGGDLYFAVTPQIGYELVSVTANGVELEEVGEAALASASDLAGYEYIYVVNEVDEDLEIVASLEEVEGMRHPAFEESVTINGVTITASAEEGILPEGTVLSAEEVTSQVENAVKEKLESEEGTSVTTVIAYDINLMLNGKKLNNTWGEGSDNYVTVQFSGERIQELSKEAEQIQVATLETPTETVEAALGGTEEAAVVEDITAEDIEVDTEGREAIEVSGDEGVETIAFEATHFTVYVVIGSGQNSSTSLSGNAYFYEITSEDPVAFAGSSTGSANVTFTVSQSGSEATITLESEALHI